MGCGQHNQQRKMNSTEAKWGKSAVGRNSATALAAGQGCLAVTEPLLLLCCHRQTNSDKDTWARRGNAPWCGTSRVGAVSLASRQCCRLCLPPNNSAGPGGGMLHAPPAQHAQHAQHAHHAASSAKSDMSAMAALASSSFRLFCTTSNASILSPVCREASGRREGKGQNGGQ